jgi:hypothetical protein
VSDEELFERASSVPYADYVRACVLMAPNDDAAAEYVRNTISALRAEPDAGVVMGPDFLCVLALFSSMGRSMAENGMSLAEITRRQRHLARQLPAIARQFPDVLADNA